MVVDSGILQGGGAPPWVPRYKGSHSLIVQNLPQCPSVAGERSASGAIKIIALAVSDITPVLMPDAGGVPASDLKVPRQLGGDLNGDGGGSGGRHVSGAFDLQTLPPPRPIPRVKT